MTAQDAGGRPETAAPYAIELKGISKAFGPVQANKDIDLRVAKGSIHGIIGENGAGKSTLMSILYGFYKPDRGRILVNGEPIAIADSQTAIRAGIGMVFQHFKLVQNFTVLENIILGVEDGAPFRRRLTGLARWGGYRCNELWSPLTWQGRSVDRRCSAPSGCTGKWVHDQGEGSRSASSIR